MRRANLLRVVPQVVEDQPVGKGRRRPPTRYSFFRPVTPPPSYSQRGGIVPCQMSGNGRFPSNDYDPRRHTTAITALPRDPSPVRIRRSLAFLTSRSRVIRLRRETATQRVGHRVNAASNSAPSAKNAPPTKSGCGAIFDRYAASRTSAMRFCPIVWRRRLLGVYRPAALSAVTGSGAMTLRRFARPFLPRPSRPKEKKHGNVRVRPGRSRAAAMERGAKDRSQACAQAPSGLGDKLPS